MLGDKYFLKINDIELNCNFRFIKNLYNYLEENPIKWLFNWIETMNDDGTEIIIQCMSSKLCNFKNLLKNDIDKANILLGLANLIEKFFKTNNDENSNKNNIDDIDKKEFNFENWWNRWYFIGTKILNMSEEEFLNSSCYEISILESLNMEYKKSILIGAYVDVLKAQNKADKGNNKNNNSKIVNKNNNVRIRDLLK